MIKIGITGGIGSGKSTVCEVWESLGAFVINADELAKDMLINNEAIKHQIIAAFGRESYQTDGSLNREYLAREAFEKGRVEELNAIVHPHVPKEVELLMKNAADQGYVTAVYEAALLLQNLQPEGLDCIVLVLADKANRIEWVKQRDQVAQKLVTDRMGKQQHFEQLTHLADYLIENNGTLDDLKKKAQEVYQEIVSACVG